MFICTFFFLRRKSERNFASALCNLIALTLLFVSLNDERWFYLHAGRCNRNLIDLKTFFTRGKLYHQDDIYIYKGDAKTELTACVDTRSIFLLRMIITLICLTIFSSLIALILDLIGSMRNGWKWIRRYAICQITSVFLSTCVFVLCFCLSEILYEIQYRNRMKIGKKVLVQYDIAYYLFVLANNFSLLSIIITLIRRDSIEIIDEQDEILIERAQPASILSDPPPAYSE